MNQEQLMALLSGENPSNPFQQQGQQQANYGNQQNQQNHHTSPMPPSNPSFGGPPSSGRASSSYPYPNGGQQQANTMSDQEAFLAQFSSGGAGQPQGQQHGQQGQHQQQPRPSSSSSGQFNGQPPQMGADIMKQMEAMQQLRRQPAGGGPSYQPNQFHSPGQNAMSPQAMSAGSPAAILGPPPGGMPNFPANSSQQQQQLLLMQQQYKMREQQQQQQQGKQRAPSVGAYSQMGSIAEGGAQAGGGGSPSLPQGAFNPNHPPGRPSSSLSQHQFQPPRTQPSPAPSNSNSNTHSTPHPPPQPNPANPNAPTPSTASGGPPQPRPSQMAGFLKALGGAAASKGITLPKWFLEGEGVEGGRPGTFGVAPGVGPDGGSGGGQRIDALVLWTTCQQLGGMQHAFTPQNVGKIFQAIGLSQTLSTPTPVIDINYNPAHPPRMTTNPLELLVSAYKAFFGPFEELRFKQVQTMKAAQAFAAQQQQANGGSGAAGPPTSGQNVTKEQLEAYMAHQAAQQRQQQQQQQQQQQNGAQGSPPNPNIQPPTPTAQPQSTPQSAGPSSLPLPPSSANLGPSPTPAASTQLSPNPPPQNNQLGLGLPSQPTAAGLYPPFALNAETRSMMAKLSPEQQQQFIMQAMRAQAQAQAAAHGQGVGQAGRQRTPSTGATGPEATPIKVETEEERRDRKNKKRKVEEPSTSSALALSVPLPPSPAEKHRPRNKISYIPLQRDATTYGGWDIDGIEQERLRAKANRKVRPINELGPVDIEGLLMSLRSRMQSEVAYALTVLEMLSVQPSGSKEGLEGVLPLRNCPEMLEELVDLLEEVAIGEGGLAQRTDAWKGKTVTKVDVKEEDRSEDSEMEGAQEDSSAPPSCLTHSSLVLLGKDNVDALRSPRDEDAESKSTRPAELILVIVNIFRNLAGQVENIPVLGRSVPLVHILLAICEPAMAGLSSSLEPLPKSAACPPPFSIIDLVNVRKDVLYILAHLSPEIRFSADGFSPALVQATFDFVTSFIHDPDGELFPSTTSDPATAVRTLIPVPFYLEMAITAFSRLTVMDDNRAIVGRLPTSDLWDLYGALIRLVPITEADYARTTQDLWLSFTERVALSIYNLVFLAPFPLKARIRQKSAYTSVLVRLLRRFYSHTLNWRENVCNVLCRRTLETFGVLNEGGEGDGAGAWLDFGTGGGKENEVKKKPNVEMPGWLVGHPGLFEGFFAVKDADSIVWEELDGLLSDL